MQWKFEWWRPDSILPLFVKPLCFQGKTFGTSSQRNLQNWKEASGYQLLWTVNWHPAVLCSQYLLHQDHYLHHRFSPLWFQWQCLQSTRCTSLGPFLRLKTAFMVQNRQFYQLLSELLRLFRVMKWGFDWQCNSVLEMLRRQKC